MAAPLLRRGGRSDEHRHLDLHAPPLRCRPRLPNVGRRPVRHLPLPSCSGHAVRAAAQAGTAGADARRRAGRGRPARAHRQPFSWRGLSQGLGAAASCGPADVEGARAPPDARERPVGDNPHGPSPRAAQSRRHDHHRDHRHHVGNRHDRRLHRRAWPGRRLHRRRPLLGRMRWHPARAAARRSIREADAVRRQRRAALHGTRHEALEPVRQGVAERFGGVEKDAAAGLGIRHDHGSQYMSRDFQKEITWLGATSSPAFVRAPRLQGLLALSPSEIGWKASWPFMATAAPNASSGR